VWLVLTLGRVELSTWRGGTAFLGSSLPRTRQIAVLASWPSSCLALGGWQQPIRRAGCPDLPKCQGNGGRRSRRKRGHHSLYAPPRRRAGHLLLVRRHARAGSRSDDFSLPRRHRVLGTHRAAQHRRAMVLRRFPGVAATSAPNAGAALLLWRAPLIVPPAGVGGRREYTIERSARGGAGARRDPLARLPGAHQARVVALIVAHRVVGTLLATPALPPSMRCCSETSHRAGGRFGATLNHVLDRRIARACRAPARPLPTGA